MREHVLFAWSGGKDSAMALFELQKTGEYEVSALMTTITQDYDRISMHGVRRVLLEQQTASLGYPLERVFISKNSSNEEYQDRMQQVCKKYLKTSVYKVVFGDIFLEDVKKYREEHLSKIGMQAVFPLWQRDSKKLAHDFINSDFKAVITCIDSERLDKRFAGRQFDAQFLAELPHDVDPCGENGEFHSFVYDGPIFKQKLSYKSGEIVLRDNRFYYVDLIPLGYR